MRAYIEVIVIHTSDGTNIGGIKKLIFAEGFSNSNFYLYISFISYLMFELFQAKLGY